MEPKGSMVDSIQTRLRIYPPQQFIAFLNALPDEEVIPDNILKVIGRDRIKGKIKKDNAKPNINLNNDDVKYMKRIYKCVSDNLRFSDTNGNKDNAKLKKKEDKPEEKTCSEVVDWIQRERAVKVFTDKKIVDFKAGMFQNHSKLFLTTMDIDWVYRYLQNKKDDGANVPYLHVLMKGANIEMPENEDLDRNSELRARCNKMRTQQEGQEYTTMSLKITVDDLSLKMKRFEGISIQRTSFTSKNWNKYIHKRCKVGKKEKEHQD